MLERLHENGAISRQDIKDAVVRSQLVLKTAAKYKMALWTLAGAMQDMSEAIIDLGRCRAVKMAERSNPSGVRQDGMNVCGELHLTMSKRIREFGDRVQREFEDPFQRGIEEHANIVVSNEKRLAYMGKQLQEKIKKAEGEVRKRRNKSSEQGQLAAKELAMYTRELQELKHANVNVILGEEARNLRAMEQQWAKLLKSQALLFGQCVAGAAACADDFSGETPGRGTGAAILKDTLFSNQIASAAEAQSSARRGSLDSNVNFHTETNSKQVEDAARFNSLGRAVAKLAGAVASQTSTGPGSPSLPSSRTGTVQQSSGAPKLSLPAFSVSLGDTVEKTSFTPSQPPRPIIKSKSAATVGAAEKGTRRVMFPTATPIATVSSGTLETPTSPNLTLSLSSLYPDIFATNQIVSEPVQPHKAVPRNPAVYVPDGDGDAESQMGSVVGASESLVSVVHSHSKADLVYAIHDFAARSSKEMSLLKGDVIEVRKRQGTWIYGTKLQRKRKGDGTLVPSASPSPPPQNSTAKGFVDRFRRGPPQQQAPQPQVGPALKPEVGWIPMAFVAKFSAN
ncbi:hypothetical protein DFS34DRAFT_632499 [Phlyctochytrium arcticum]|nr:hypothetical protein DFS34DRAFT_632499 [Phlyctochytrium arcticum]